MNLNVISRLLCLALAWGLTCRLSAQTNTAQAHFYSRSIAVDPGYLLLDPDEFEDPAERYDFFVQLFLTTFDGKTNQAPLTLTSGNGGISPNSEVRPRAGQDGVYEADYLVMVQTNLESNASIEEYGSVVLDLPTTDSNSNGVPDVLEADLAFNTTATGTSTSDFPGRTNFSVAVAFTRPASNSYGTYVFASTNDTNGVSFEGNFQVLNLAGTAAYSRSNQNRIEFNVQVVGFPRVFTGSTTFTTPNANQIALPQFTLRTTNNVTLTTLPVTLTRSGSRYVGTLQFADGELGTSWKDFLEWIVVLDDPNDANADGTPDLSDPTQAPDTTAPTLTITSPAANAVLSNTPAITVQGSAGDNVGVNRVEYRVNGGSFANATGTTAWSFSFEPVAGVNTIEVRAIDHKGNTTSASRSIRYVVRSLMTVEITGNGTVSPNYNGQMLEVGATYSMTALPGVGSVSRGWSGDLTTNNAKITFVMTEGLVLSADFIPNPFTAVSGNYCGLFSEPLEAHPESSGSLLLTVTGTGGFTGSLNLAGKKVSLKGAFSLQDFSGVTYAIANLVVPRPGATPLEVGLQINVSTPEDLLQGVVVNSNLWEANIAAPRAIYSATNPCPVQGSYTVVFPGTPGDDLIPAGPGYATLTVDVAGKTKLVGVLADGTKITHAGVVTAGDELDIHVALLKGLGMLHGFGFFAESEFDDFGGGFTWVRPADLKAKVFKDGVDTILAASASRYRAPAAGTRVIDVPEPLVGFSEGNLTDPQEYVVTLTTANKITTNPADKLAITITTKTGLLKGTFVPVGATKPVAFNGVIFQKMNSGFGLFFGTTQSGEMVLR
ncbi:MAG TPA: Ig-like domain-containing protein [Methylomirabilota bacterium]|nr:Ig-like domain-containing protein [Methylomirabilota bacterium]